MAKDELAAPCLCQRQRPTKRFVGTLREIERDKDEMQIHTVVLLNLPIGHCTRLLGICDNDFQGVFLRGIAKSVVCAFVWTVVHECFHG